MNSGSKIYGWDQFKGDTCGTLWWIWWYGYAWGKGGSSDFVPILNYPFGVNRSVQPIAPFLNYPVAAVNFFLKDEIFTYNFVVLLSIILAALCMFVLVRYLTGCTSAGVFAGLVFGFCPNQLMQSAQHLGFAVSFWIPLFVLCLFRMKRRPCFISVVLCSLSAAAVILSNYYYGYFIFLFAILFILWWFITEGVDFLKIRALAIAGVLTVIFVLPFVFRFISGAGIGGTGVAHPAADIVKYSARWWDFLIPGEFHPVFGGWSEKWVTMHEGSRHFFERSLYLGFLPICLGLWAVIKKKDPVVVFFSITAIIFFIFSLSPVFCIFGLKIPNLSFFAYKVLPMFRVYARIGILVILSVAIIAGFGLKYILDGIKNKWGRGVVASLCVFIVLFEYLNFPPFHNVDLSKTPDVYEWLAGEPEGLVIVEYPFVRKIEPLHSEYLFYQRIHKKPLVNGARGGTLGDAFRWQMQNPDSLETAGLLAYLGADYMIVHKEFYNGKELKMIENNQGLRLLKDFNNVKVYNIVTEPESLVTVFWKNFGSWEKWDDGIYWRWMGNNATVWIGNGPVQMSDVKCQMSDKKEVAISFRILPFARDRELEVYVNNVLVKKLDIPVISGPEFAEKVVLEDILLQPGENTVRFYTPQGDDRIGDVLGNEDERKVSFAISEFSAG